MKMTYHSEIGRLLMVAVLLLTGSAAVANPETSEPQTTAETDLVGSKWRLVYKNPK